MSNVEVHIVPVANLLGLAWYPAVHLKVAVAKPIIIVKPLILALSRDGAITRLTPTAYSTAKLVSSAAV